MEFFVNWLIENAVSIATSFLFVVILSVTCFKLIKQKKGHSTTNNANTADISEDIVDVFGKAKTIFNIVYKDKKIKSLIDKGVNFIKSIFSNADTKAVMSKSKDILKVLLLEDDKSVEVEKKNLAVENENAEVKNENVAKENKLDKDILKGIS